MIENSEFAMGRACARMLSGLVPRLAAANDNTPSSDFTEQLCAWEDLIPGGMLSFY